MKEFMLGIVAGMVCTATVFAIVGIVPDAKEALAECERSLPRDQTCRLIAVPKETKNEH